MGNGDSRFSIPTAPIGSILRSTELLSAMRSHAARKESDDHLRAAEGAVFQDTISRLQKTGSPVITDGEQTKPSFALIRL